jgi:hypothetical protein
MRLAACLGLALGLACAWTWHDYRQAQHRPRLSRQVRQGQSCPYLGGRGL